LGVFQGNSRLIYGKENAKKRGGTGKSGALYACYAQKKRSFVFAALQEIQYFVQYLHILIFFGQLYKKLTNKWQKIMAIS